MLELDRKKIWWSEDGREQHYILTFRSFQPYSPCHVVVVLKWMGKKSVKTSCKSALQNADYQRRRHDYIITGGRRKGKLATIIRVICLRPSFQIFSN